MRALNEGAGFDPNPTWSRLKSRSAVVCAGVLFLSRKGGRS